MKRLHLFEIGDQSWCPHIIRELITDFLAGLYNLLGIFEPAYHKIAEILIKTDLDTIVDCCSGSGGPVTTLRQYLDARQLHTIRITLTDKYPNLKQFAHLESIYPGLVGHKESIDATRLPPFLNGLRCFFSSFHHFRPEQATQILQDAVNNNAPIAIFESTERHIVDIARAMISPVLMLLLFPFTRKLNLNKFVLIYLLPIAPLVFMWDYLVSNLRTYSKKDLQNLINQLDAPHYQWEIGKLWSKKAKSNVLYLVGYSANDKGLNA